jgi:hypothetical protein
VGRPLVDAELERWILRVAKDNMSIGVPIISKNVIKLKPDGV